MYSQVFTVQSRTHYTSIMIIYDSHFALSSYLYITVVNPTATLGQKKNPCFLSPDRPYLIPSDPKLFFLDHNGER